MAQPLELETFNGGITDYYVGGALNKMKKCDNLLIIKHGTLGKPFTRPGSQVYNLAHAQIPAGAQRIGTLKYFEGKLLVHSARDFYIADPTAAYVTILGPTGNKVFPAGNTINNTVSVGYWNNQLYVCNDNMTRPQRMYLDENGVLQLRTVGTPDISGLPPTLTASSPGTASYIYRFLVRYEYKVSEAGASGSFTFQDRGTGAEVFIDNANTISAGNPVNISNIPVVTNGTVDNYDTASPNLVVEIYRTTDAGGAFFLAGTVPNGTTVFADQMDDNTLQNGQPLYTEGGNVEVAQPPLCRVLHITDNYGYYGNVTDTGQLIPNRLLQSLQGAVGAVPTGNYVDLADNIRGISSVRGIPVVVCDRLVYRIDGTYDSTGAGGMVPQRIGDVSGCVSSQSMVQTLEGVFWAGPDGFYFSDAYNVLKLNKEWDQTYAGIVEISDKAFAQARIQGKYDAQNRRIYWCVWESAQSVDVDKIYILDLNWGITAESCFTSLSGTTNFSPTAVEFVNNQLIRGDRRGYLLIHKDNLFSDPKIDTTIPANTWDTAPIIFDLRTVATNFGSNLLRKFTTRVSAHCKNDANLSLQIVSNSDDGRKIENLKPIRFRSNCLWGDPDVYWNDAGLRWDVEGLINDWRRFPAASLRCTYKQIYLTNAFVAIINSDLLGPCTVDNFNHQATLVDVAGFDWPTKSNGYSIAFANDGYTRNFLIISHTNDTLTFEDPLGFAPTGTQEWVIRGIPKDEILDLVSLMITYESFGQTNQPFMKTDTGEVGAS